MRAIALLLTLLASSLAVCAEPRPPEWDHLPIIAYQGEDVAFSWRADGSPWTVRNGIATLAARDEDGGRSQAVSVRIAEDPGARDLAFVHAGGGAATVRFVEPGAGAGMALGEGRRVTIDGCAAVLVLPRVESDSDRRWKLLGTLAAGAAIRCGVVLAEPAASADGILGIACAAQAVDVRGTSVLVLAPASDRQAGWTHRTYRQLVAWVVADAMKRGAVHVVVMGPIAPRADLLEIAPLQRQVSDVAAAYRCRCIDAADMADERYWQVTPGILGPHLNEAGRAALADLLRPWRTDGTP